MNPTNAVGAGFLRERQEQWEAERLSPLASLSARTQGRLVPEPPDDLRTEFQRDRDRVIHTNAFRRLKHKTQVFVAPIGDHFVTRLTHTLEVTQIARTLARALRLNEDLVEAASLGHDVGHTPFGHIGEQVLDALHPGGFRHNEQSLRTIDVLEKDGAGLNLTYETRMAVLHHSKPRGDFPQRRRARRAEPGGPDRPCRGRRRLPRARHRRCGPRGRARRGGPPDGRPRAARLPPLAADRHDGPRHRHGLVGLRGLRRP